MNNFTFTQDNCKEETTSIWLISVLQFGSKLEVFKPFENFKLKMKKVKYSVSQKLIATIMSIIIGCETTRDINEKLAVEKLALNMFNMNTVPDQSQINELIRLFDSESIKQLQDIHHNLFMNHNNSVNSYTKVVVDCGQTGLIAKGKSFEVAEKGCFSKKKNQRDYQLSAAFTGEHSETVAMFLDSGNTHCSDHYDDLLKAIISKYKEQLYSGNLILRTDSDYDSTRKASNLAQGIGYSEYIQADDAAWVYELPEIDGVRYIIVQTLSKRGKLKYSLLITNISANDMNAVEIFHFYNKRQTIEAFFKMAKNVCHIKNLRTSKFYAFTVFYG